MTAMGTVFAPTYVYKPYNGRSQNSSLFHNKKLLKFTSKQILCRELVPTFRLL